MDILKDQWLVFPIVCFFITISQGIRFRAAAMTLRTVLLSLQALLSAAEPDDPQDAVVAKQFKENIDMFQMTARHWTNVYAGGTSILNMIIIVCTYSKKLNYKSILSLVTSI